MTSPGFTRFEPALVAFLEELAANNDRAWFAGNKGRYERDVLAPALAFVEAMQAPLAAISRHFLAVPRRSGGSVMRVYRDTRFGKDKTPYKTNVGIHFRHEIAKNVHAPGFYVHVEPGDVFLGAGIWRPEPGPLAKIRAAIDERPRAWKAARGVRGFPGTFALHGERLKRPPQGYAADHPLIEDLKRKDFIAVHAMPQERLTSPAFLDDVVETFTVSRPFVRFLCQALEVPF